MLAQLHAIYKGSDGLGTGRHSGYWPMHTGVPGTLNWDLYCHAMYKIHHSVRSLDA